MTNQKNLESHSHSDPADWQPCETGELQQLGQRLSARHRSQQLSKYAQAGAWGLLLMAIGVFLGNLSSSKRVPQDGFAPILIGGITCGDCVQGMEDYHAHLKGELEMPTEQAEQMKAHLADCDMCRPKFEEMYPGVLELNASNQIQRLHLALIGESAETPQLVAMGSRSKLIY